MKQLYTIMQKIIIYDFNSYFRQSTWRVYCPISLKWDLDTGKILFTQSFNKHEQFYFSLLVIGKSTDWKKSISLKIINKYWLYLKGHF